MRVPAFISILLLFTAPALLANEVCTQLQQDIDKLGRPGNNRLPFELVKRIENEGKAANCTLITEDPAIRETCDELQDEIDQIEHPNRLKLPFELLHRIETEGKKYRCSLNGDSMPWTFPSPGPEELLFEKQYEKWKAENL